jgi:hypothetical protein
MRDSIARLVTWVLSVLAPRTRKPGKHSAAYLTDQPAPKPEPTPASPWARPWTGPTKEEAAEFFRRQSETTMPLTQVQRERRTALAEAAMGRDYPYSFPGAPFPRSAFAGAGAVSA